MNVQDKTREKLNHVNGVILSFMCRIAEKKEEISDNKEEQQELLIKVGDVEDVLQEAQKELHQALTEIET